MSESSPNMEERRHLTRREAGELYVSHQSALKGAAGAALAVVSLMAGFGVWVYTVSASKAEAAAAVPMAEVRTLRTEVGEVKLSLREQVGAVEKKVDDLADKVETDMGGLRSDVRGVGTKIDNLTTMIIRGQLDVPIRASVSRPEDE